MGERSQKNMWLVVLVTVCLWGASVVWYRGWIVGIEKRRSDELRTHLEFIAEVVRDRKMTMMDLVYSLRSLLETWENGSAARWSKFVKTQEFESRLPDVSLTYVEKVEVSRLSNYETSVRGSEGGGYEKYKVFPKPENEIALPVRYASEKLDTLSLFGFDVASLEDVFYEVMVAGRSNQPVVVGPVDLSTSFPSDKRSHYMLVLPVYDRTDVESLNEEEKWKSVTGFVVAWTHADSFLKSGTQTRGVRYLVVDGDQEVATWGAVGKVTNRVSNELSILNKKLVIVLEADRDFKLSVFEERLPGLGFWGVVFVNLLWVFTAYEMLSVQQMAVEYARMVSKDLRKFKQAVDGVSDHVMITDPNGYITYANEAAAAVTGYKVAEMIGQRPSLWGGQMSRGFYERFWRTIKTEKRPFWGELTNRRKSGELYPVELRVSPILDEKGNLLFFVGIERDLSRVRAIDKLKTEFISLASHQLRTPLSAAKWFTEILLNGNVGRLNKLQEKYLRKIDEANEREIHLVNALLNVSKIESGKIEVVPKPTDLRTMLEVLFGDFRVDIAGENKRLEYVIDKKLPSLMIDPDMIKHVYTNLLTNALHYTDVGGKVEVRVFVKDGKVVSEIKDDGIGIPKKEQSRIYDKFFRASNALKKVTEGSGLGLYLAKTIVESSGGRIWFKSAEGKGTTFWFSLPIRSIKHKGSNKKPR